MNDYYKKLQQVAAKVDAMTLRERILLLCGVAVVLHMCWNFLFWQPLQDKEKRLQGELVSVQEENREIEQNLVGLGQKFGIDYNAETESMIEELLKEVEALESKSSELAALLVAPDEMARLLEQLLLDRGGLRLVKLENSISEAATGEFDTTEQAEGQKVDTMVEPSLSPGIYRHDFVLELEGDFFPILEYLRSLESLPKRFFWDAVEYDVEEYPQAKVRIRLHTLSLSEGWVGV